MHIDTNRPFGIAVAILVTVTVFLATAAGLSVAGHFTAQAILVPAQTTFRDNTPPDYFPVVVEVRDAASRRYVLAQWHSLARALETPGSTLVPSVRAHRWADGEASFDVSGHVIEVRIANTSNVRARYRVDEGRFVPLYFKTDGGMGYIPYLFAILAAAFVVAVEVSRRVFSRITVAGRPPKRLRGAV